VASAEQRDEVPREVATVLPTGAAHTQAIVKSLEANIADIKSDIRDIKGYRHSDFVYLITLFAGGFVFLCGLFIAGYLRLDDKVDRLTQTSIKIETKLEDLLLRIPPAITPPPKR